MSAVRILVFGGRDFTDRAAMFEALDALRCRRAISAIIHGAARGADSLAGEWARDRGVPEQAFPADWQKHGKAAGPIRNQQMIEEGKPDGAVAFPGGRGTADMVRRLAEAHISVWLPMEVSEGPFGPHANHSVAAEH